MDMNLLHVERVATITKKDFLKQYFKPQKPVVIERFIEDWPAFTKWNLSYMKKVAGEKIVPLYDDRPVNYQDGFNEPHAKMKMADYIDLLENEPTKFRIFLWNILKEVPILQYDFYYPDFGLRLMKGLPMLFFGGKDSYTFMHYDIDLANIFHFHFHGKKEVILFDQQQNDFLYKTPFSLITSENIDFSNPDFEKWPALKKATGFITNLEHGNVLYIPEGYWHYMKYITPGFSMSLRSIAHKPKNFLKAIYNIFIMRNIDNIMRRIRGQKWIDWKNEYAVKKINSF
ncbi:MAG: cupin-like domain-containing protein [Flavobacteriia bacterium]|nr:cupin-like domain-containing protein [Flavobacteriia bacterium]PIV95851.1 MAG: cupin [Flavobacteriaceae bacterium CG17_big_fil_post_rev_8_21_14_2_50_31_13]PIX13993.1 MAG: cupin [Flavobacteriaceae bacterium CG_4_8_14_3_um_filter_31_8]PIY15336.1 MAG: cupin [Flavobacteriaceae bacterium CG_4_10_14_3_um_filter_31_253]PIZ11103.1 MAG: cupin [Flavobacteriaceae bacterium CG_4_10_14_0_8_um_filter_31_99]PJC09639.1 MAG: cupin [Flavobacteriaceae bacterium CG_4_9_14_0_8_um_filter_31_91]